MRDCHNGKHLQVPPSRAYTGACAAVAWSWDYDGASDVLRTRRPHPSSKNGGVCAVVPCASLREETPDARRVAAFWDSLARASPDVPALVMSGSARVYYQRPGEFEQDGIDHVAMQDEGLRRHGLRVRVDRHALALPYDRGHGVHAPGFPDTARAKMDLVLKQVAHAQAVLGREDVVFVFVDDIYATVLADMFAQYHPRLVPPRGATVHLVHFERARPPARGVARPPPPRRVAPHVRLFPYY